MTHEPDLRRGIAPQRWKLQAKKVADATREDGARGTGVDERFRRCDQISQAELDIHGGSKNLGPGGEALLFSPWKRMESPGQS